MTFFWNERKTKERIMKTKERIMTVACSVIHQQSTHDLSIKIKRFNLEINSQFTE